MNKIEKLIFETIKSEVNINLSKYQKKKKINEIPNFDSVAWAKVLLALELKFGYELDLDEFTGNETITEFISIIKKQK